MNQKKTNKNQSGQLRKKTVKEFEEPSIKDPVPQFVGGDTVDLKIGHSKTIGNVTIYSAAFGSGCPISGLCFFIALTNMAYSENKGKDNQMAIAEYDRAYTSALACAQKGGFGQYGHTMDTIKYVCRDLGVNVVSAQEFKSRILGGEKLELKQSEEGLLYLPAVIVDKAHAYLAWPLGQQMKLKTSFSYSDLANAFDNGLKNLKPEDQGYKPLKNSMATMLKKRLKKMENKLPGNKIKGSEGGEVKVVYRPDRAAEIYRQAFQQAQSIDYLNLPEYHETDRYILYYYFYIKEKIDHPERVRDYVLMPQSQYAYRVFFSANKKKSPIHEQGESVEVTTYTFKQPTAPTRVQTEPVRADPDDRAQLSSTMKVEDAVVRKSKKIRNVRSLVVCGTSNCGELKPREILPSRSANDVDLYSIYASHVSSQSREMKYINVPQPRVNVTSNRVQVKISVIPAGPISPSFSAILNQNFSPEELRGLKERKGTHGGHSNLGYLRDLFQADINEQWLTAALNDILSGNDVTVVHVGSKFSQIQTLTQKVIKSMLTSVAYKIGLEYEATEEQPASHAFTESLEKFRGLKRPLDWYRHSFDTFLRSMDNNDGQRMYEHWMNECPYLERAWGELTIVHIRPNSDGYDQTYYSQNLQAFRTAAEKDPIFYEQYLFAGTIQQFSQLQNMADKHFYAKSNLRGKGGEAWGKSQGNYYVPGSNGQPSRFQPLVSEGSFMSERHPYGIFAKQRCSPSIVEPKPSTSGFPILCGKEREVRFFANFKKNSSVSDPNADAKVFAVKTEGLKAKETRNSLLIEEEEGELLQEFKHDLSTWVDPSSLKQKDLAVPPRLKDLDEDFKSEWNFLNKLELGVLSGSGKRYFGNVPHQKGQQSFMYVMMDSHYYMSPTNEQERKETFHVSDARFFIQGMQFTAVPGRYILPFGEGEFTVSNDQKIRMSTNGNGHVYNHPNRMITDMSGGRVLNLGWFTCFTLQVNYDNFLVQEPLKLHGPTPNVSGQFRWLHSKGQIIENNSYVKKVQNMLPQDGGKKALDIQIQQMERALMHGKSRSTWTTDLMPRTDTQAVSDRIKNAVELGMIEDVRGKVFSKTSWFITRTFTVSDVEKDPHSSFYQKAVHKLLGPYGQSNNVVIVKSDPNIYCGRGETDQTLTEKSRQVAGLGEQRAEPTKKDFTEISRMAQTALLSVNQQKEFKEVAKQVKCQVNKKTKAPEIGPMTIMQEEYYKQVEPNPSLWSINPLISNTFDLLHNNHQLEAAQAYSRAHFESGPKCFDKGQLLDAKLTLKGKVTTLAGSITYKDGERVKEFEFASKSLNNKVHAVYERQFSAKQSYDPSHMSNFKKVIRPWIQKCVTQFLLTYDCRQNLMDYPTNKSEWSVSKRTKYAANIHRVFHDENYRDYVGSFEATAKAGETDHIYGEFKEDDRGYTVGLDSAPRMICNPEDAGFGIIQAIQSTWWPALKQAVPGFIHSYTKDQIKDKVREHIRSTWKSISLDGSRWDTTQWSILQQIVENSFIEGIFTSVVELINYNKETYFPNAPVSVEQICSNLMKNFMSVENHLFVHLPGVDSPQWPTNIQNRFFKMRLPYTSYPEHDYVHHAIVGTTFSGLSFRTTLGNTFRALAYVYYYLIQTGIPDLQDPWQSDSVFVMASGDDVVIWIEQKYARRVVVAILSLTTRNRDPQCVGLGQCVKTAEIREWWQIDFCSMWSFTNTGLLDSWVLCPDFSKLYTQKQYYSKKNQEIFADPSLYAAAKLRQIQTFKCSQLLEGMLEATMHRLEGLRGKKVTDKEMDDAYNRFNLHYKEFDSSDYSVERQINEKLGLDISFIFRIYLQNEVHVVCGRDESILAVKQGKRILFTEDEGEALNALRRQDQTRMYVHKVTESYGTSSILFASITDDRILVVAGRGIDHMLPVFFNLLKSLGTICYTLGQQDIPNNVDVQKICQVKSAMAREPNIHNFIFDLEQVIDQLRYRAQLQGPTRVVTIGMSDYLIPDDNTTSSFKEDETFCSRPQVMSMLDLQNKISDTVGYKLHIVDCGSSPDPYVFDKNGYHCVYQSIFWSTYSASDSFTQQQVLFQPEELRVQVLEEMTGIRVSLIRQSTKNTGISLSVIRTLFQCNTDQRALHIWTPETPTGKFFNHGPIGECDVHIMVHHGHAYALMKQPMNWHKQPINCNHKCWEFYPQTPAYQIHQKYLQMDPRNNGKHYYCPLTNALVASYAEIKDRMVARCPEQTNPTYSEETMVQQSCIQTNMNNDQVQLLADALTKYYQTKTPNEYVKELIIDGEPTLKPAAVIWLTSTEADYLRGQLKPLAQHGVLVAISGELYRDLKSADLQRARNYIKDFTRHNDKLGFDFHVPTRKYKVSKSNQFAESNYKDFLTEAATFRSDNSELSKHFTDMASKFTIMPTERKQLLATRQTTFQVPTLPAHSREVAQLQDQLQKQDSYCERLQDEIQEYMIQQEIMAKKLESMQKTVRGYDDKAIIDPRNLQDYPRKLRMNLTKVLAHFESDAERTYIKSLIDPFHPQSQGVRVPSVLPRETATFNTFNDLDLNDPSNNAHFIVANFEVQSPIQVIRFDLPSSFFTQAPVQYTASVELGAEDYTFNAINTGLLSQQLAAAITDQQNTTMEQLYTKYRTVAAGLRFIKTSTSDSESGQIDLHYSRDGAHLDEATNINALFQRPCDSTKRVYLAGNSGIVRSTTGFVIQSNFRPHDDQSYQYQNLNQMALFSDEVTPLWFFNSTTNLLFPYDKLSTQAPGSTIHIVIESLQQRHTLLAKVSNRTAGLKLSMEVTYHYEGIPETSKYGFITRNKAQLKSAPTPFQLIQSMNVNNIFANYQMSRQNILDSIIDPTYSGLWSETLFPMFKDLVRYGAEMVPQGDNLAGWIDAALDTSLATLSTLAPELAPALVAMRQMSEKPAKQLAQRARDAVYDWSISGPQLFNLQQRPRSDTMFTDETREESKSNSSLDH